MNHHDEANEWAQLWADRTDDAGLLARAYLDLRATNDRLAETNQENAQKIEALAVDLLGAKSLHAEAVRERDEARAELAIEEAAHLLTAKQRDRLASERDEWQQRWQAAVDQVAVLEEREGKNEAELARVKAELARANEAADMWKNAYQEATGDA